MVDWLGPADRLPLRPQRVIVAGPSGSGKTTLAGAVGVLLDLPHIEIDALFHGPGWTPRAEFAADVRALAARDEWVTEWQYSLARPILSSRADLLVWLDLARPVVMRQLVRRTLRRRLRREVLWNGNVEQPLRRVLTDPEHIVRWAWSEFGRSAVRVADLRAERPELISVRLRSRRDVARWKISLRDAFPPTDVTD